MNGWACRRRTFPWHAVTMAEVQEREALLRQVDDGPTLTAAQRSRLRYLLDRAINLAPREAPIVA
mgnify:CR=1 FL=1